MGGSSKKQTVGYMYDLGMHMIFTHGPVDNVSQFKVDERILWQGISSGGAISISAPNLFGGTEREGGISGTLDFENGGPLQGRNAYLQSQLGENIPAFRGVSGVVLRKMYLGNNPYLKKWSARLQRILLRGEGEEQWYAEKALVRNSIVGATDSWEWQQSTSDIASPPSNPATFPIPSSDWNSPKPAPFGNNSTGFPYVPPIASYWAPHKAFWIKKTVTLSKNEYNLSLFTNAENSAFVYWDGVFIGAQNPTNEQGGDGSITLPVPANLTTAGEHVLAVYALDEAATGPGSDTYIYVTVNGTQTNDMNPAHIIRECLTDATWGMGYNESDIDEASFVAAADALFAEGFGLSLLWDRQTTIESFIQEIIKHIDAVLYVDRFSGLFCLKLIRADYDVDSLVVLNTGNIEKVENFTRPSFGELINSVSVNFWDSMTGKNSSVTSEDPALVQMQQAVINTTMQYPGVTNQSLASRLALRDLRTLSNPLASCVIHTNSTAKNFNVGSVFAFNWPEYGIEKMPMRITGIAFGDGVNNRIRITCSQDVFVLPEFGNIVPPDSGWETPNQPPAPVLLQKAFEMPYYELVQRTGQTVVDQALTQFPERGFVMVGGAKPQSAAINATVSIDAGAGYEDDAVLDFCAAAITSVDASVSDTVIAVSTWVDKANIAANTYFAWNDEICSVVAVNADSIEIKRGVLDTVPAEHLAGSFMLFLDEENTSDETEYVESDVVNVKLLTATGLGKLDPATATPMTVVLNSRAARPYPAANLKVNDEYSPGEISMSFSASWAHRNRLQQTGGEFIGFYEDDVTLEDGVAYTVKFYVDNVLKFEQTDVIDNFLDNISAGANGVGRLEVVSVRNDLESWQIPFIEFDYLGALTLSGDLAVPAVGLPYSSSLTATGGVAPITWSISAGALWAGTTIDPSTGVVSGTVTTTTPATFTIRATDSESNFEEKAYTSFAPIADAYSANVVLLMHLDGNNTDVKAHPFTNVGTVAYAAGKFSDALNLTTGDSGLSSAVSVADFALGSGDFTIEVFVKLAGGFTGGAVISQFDTSPVNGWQIYVSATGVPQFYHYAGSGTYPINPTGVDLRDGNWHHIAVSRSGTTMRMFIDGVMPSGGSVANSINYGSTGLYLSIGYQRQGAARYPFRGGIDEVRITKAARYTANFTPPSAPFPDPA